MKFIEFYLQSINSLEGLGMFFFSAALIRRLRRYAVTPPLAYPPPSQACSFLRLEEIVAKLVLTMSAAL